MGKKWIKNDTKLLSTYSGILFLVFLAALAWSTYRIPLENFLFPLINKEVIRNESIIENNENTIDNKVPNPYIGVIRTVIVKTIIRLVVMTIFLVIGLLLYNIRDIGFNNYKKILNILNTNKEGTKIQTGNNIKLPRLIQKIVFYIFREGSVVEECLDNVKSKYDRVKDILRRDDLTNTQRKFYTKVLKKRNRQYYDWIQKSKDPVAELRQIAEKIYKEKPNEEIYKNFCLSQLFQGLDTGALIITLICFFVGLINIVLIIFSYMLPIIPPFAIGIISLLVHLTSKHTSKHYANKYFEVIDSILKRYPNVYP